MIELGRGPEFDRIRAIARTLGGRAEGLGDDCAFLPGGWCVSTDLAVEDVHFRRAWLRPEEIGWRAAAGALSDLAAVGAAAEAVLVALAAPRDATAAWLADLMGGVGAVADSVGAKVVGGDLTGGAALTLAVTVLGRTDRPVRRDGARPGDRLFVTGSLGGARAALVSWERGAEPAAGARTSFARPEPRVAAGRWLAGLGATALIDLSDGLAGDLTHVAAASRVGARVELERLPVHPAVAAVAGGEPAVFAAQGGEDYELLVALPPGVDPGPMGPGGLPLTEIGIVMEPPAVALRLRGVPVAAAGFDHFR
ncbi:MAG: thiamine-phosphate kinase [Gemmatimonadales bacterium]